MTHPPGTEISFRHLPDLSDVSFSFQIPVATSGDLLLADDDDFFQGAGADDSLITPAATRTVHEPLTLSEITPKPKPRAGPAAQPTITSLSLAFDQSSEPKPKPARNGIAEETTQDGPSNNQKIARGKVDLRPGLKVITDALQVTSGEGSSTVGRFENLKAEVETLVRNSQKSDHMSTQTHIPVTVPQKSKLRERKSEQERIRISNPKRTATARGISKPRKGGDKFPASTLTRSITSASHIGRPRQPIELTCRLDDLSSESKPNAIQGEGRQAEGNTGVNSSANGAVAERLLIYSQQLINSFGLFNSEILPESPQTIRESIAIQSPRNLRSSGPIPNPNPIVPGHSVMDNNDNNLTLSQISPRKVSARTEAPPPPVPISMSPMRPPSKRPVSVTEHHSRKKGKVAVTVPSLAAPVLRSLQKNIGVAGGSGSGSHTNEKIKKKTRPVKTSSQVPEFGLGEGKQPMPNSMEEVQKQDEDHSKADNSENRPVLTENNEGTSAAPGRVSRFAKSTSTLRLHPTKAVGFNFQLDARMETRRAELEREKSTWHRQKQHNPLPVPDFRAMHAAQEAEIAVRKGQLMPVVPLPIELNTEGRAKERRKFDEIVKEKERGLHMAMKQRRLEREEEEHREIRELRKKAVPRAHEVPQWYKDAPKRKDKDCDSIRR